MPLMINHWCNYRTVFFHCACRCSWRERKKPFSLLSEVWTHKSLILHDDNLQIDISYWCKKVMQVVVSVVPSSRLSRLEDTGVEQIWKTVIVMICSVLHEKFPPMTGLPTQ